MTHKRSVAERALCHGECLYVTCTRVSKSSCCCGRVGRSVCPLAPRRPSLGRLVDVPSLRFFFLRDYLDAMALASGFVASLAGIASEFIILATWLVVLGYFLALGLSLFPSVLPAPGLLSSCWHVCSVLVHDPGLLMELMRRIHGYCGEQDWNIWKIDTSNSTGPELSHSGTQCSQSFAYQEMNLRVIIVAACE